MKRSRRSTSGPISLVVLHDSKDEIGRAMAIRREAFSGDVGLREICEANGLDENAFVRDGHLLRSLDLFMSGLRDVRSLSHFGGLTELCFINMPNLNSVGWLDTCCPGLSSVNITECSLKTTDGIEGLTGLTTLNLSSNDLQSLDGVRGLTSLRKLWANDNHIHAMDGLSSLTALEELWLCRNRFTEIGDGLPLGPALREINVSHNRLGCFKELLKLAPLEGLRSLALQDPHFGDNPVCGLSNYKTYVAYHLTQLASLDMEVVSEESKAFANTVFLKKSMYYNMRSRIVKRHAGHVVRKATELCGEKAADLQTTLIHMQWQSKHVEQRIMAERVTRELDIAGVGKPDEAKLARASAAAAAVATGASSFAKGGGESEMGETGDDSGGVSVPPGSLVVVTGKGTEGSSSSSPAVESGLEMLQLRAKGKALARAVVVVEGVLHKMEEQLEVFKQVVGHACKRAVSELMLEFDTGGNVRFEEGRPGDVWFSSCVDLVKSRVGTNSGKGAPGVKVSRVIRIHNRFLKNRFERCVREATASQGAAQERNGPSPTTQASSTPTNATTTGTTTTTAESNLADEQQKETAYQLSSQSSQSSVGDGSTYSPAHERGRPGEDIELANDGGGTSMDASGEAAGTCRGGSKTSTDLDASRKQTLGVSRREQAGKYGAPATCDPSCANDSSTRHGAEHGNSSETGEDVNHNPVCRKSSGNSVNTITAATPSKRESNGERGRWDGGGDASNRTTSGGAGSKKNENGKRSASSRIRSLEYLFFTGRRSGTGFDCGINTTSKRRGNANDETGERKRNRHQQPDLLKLAEDGFHLPDWSETDFEDSSSREAAPLDAELPSPQPQRPTVDGMNEAEAKSTRGREERRSSSFCSWPQAVVLSSHLSEADIPGMSGDASITAPDGEKHLGISVAPATSFGVGTDQEYLSPVCRVLVVKVYTGRSQRLPPQSPSDGGSRGDTSGSRSSTVEPNVLREVWAAGFKSVCVTPAARGHGDGVSDGGGGGGGESDDGRGSASSNARCQEWHVLDGALALPEYIIEFDISPEMGKGGQAIKDGVRQRVNKWRHELVPTSRSPVPPLASPSSASSLPVTAATPNSSAATPASGSSGSSSAGGGGRAAGATDVLPFLIPLARLARQLEIDAASYTARYEAGISKALRMQPSAPVLGVPPSSKDGAGCGDDREETVRDRPAFSIATGSSHLLTRLSLHGQGVRTIAGLEACQNLRVLILSFNEISRLDGLNGLHRLQHLDLGYNVIEGVQHYRGTSPPTPGSGGDGGDSIAHPGKSASSVMDKDPPIIILRSHDNISACGRSTAQDGELEEAAAAGMRGSGDAGDAGGRGCRHSGVGSAEIVLPALTRLDLNNNILHDLDDLKALWELAPALSVLDMRGNPLRTARTYRGAAIRSIPGLGVLDGRAVTRKEVALHNACRSLTLDMLRRNGRRTAPWSAPHHPNGHDSRSCRRSTVSGVRTDGTNSDDDGYRQKLATYYTKANDGLGDDQSVGGKNDNIIDHHHHGEPGEGKDNGREADGTKGADKRTQDKEEVGGGGRPIKPSTAGTVTTAEPSPSEKRGNVAAGKGRPSSAPAPAPALDNVGIKTDVKKCSVSGAESESGGSRGGGCGGNTSSSSLPYSYGLVLEEIELVNLPNLSLHKLEGIERLARLRVADLSGNELHDTAPLRWCACLEELNLEGNELTTAGLRGLVGLRRLVKLDLGYNQISDLHPLCCLTGLSQLSLESNLLHNLRGLGKLVHLMELYCGNNDIVPVSEVDRLTSLLRLIILDTSGNPMCSTPHFRLLVLFKIPKLKVLDGVGVGGVETAEAKLKFVGKLTEDVIWNKYDADKVETLKYLDLSKGKWRSVEVLPSLPFRSLQELNLDRNFLVNFATLGTLQSLGVLRLSYNRIESIGQAESDTLEKRSMADQECVFAQLEVLYLGFNRISDIAALCLECMPRLLAVDLQNNNIGNLGGLNRCHTLVEVNLDGNKIRQLGPPSVFDGLSNLRKLRLEDNGLKVLSPGLAASTPALLSLSLAQNRLSDPAELDRLGPLPNLIELSVCGNPMARRSYSRLALLALFPSLAAVDSTDITPEEKRLAEAIAEGNAGTSIATAPTNANSAGAWGLAVPGVAGSGGGGGGGGIVVGGTGVTPVGGNNRREYFTVGTIGSIVRKSSVATQGGGMGGYPTGTTTHAFSPFRPHDSLPPPSGAVSGSARIGGSPGDRGGRVSMSGDDCFVQARTLTMKAGPASPATPGSEDGGGGDGTGGGHNRGQPHHSPKWAPLSTTRRMSTGGGGVKRPLKLTSMSFSSTATGEDERGATGSRGMVRNASSIKVVGGIVGGGGSGNGGSGGSDRVCFGGNIAGGKTGAALATLDAGARVSPTLSYGKIISLPTAGSGMGVMSRRYER